MWMRAVGLSIILAGVATPGLAQDYGAMIDQQMAAMNNMLNGAQQQANMMVQQKMQDPQVQQAYQAYVYQARMSGQPVMDFPTYTYNYIYTNGFSAQGVAAARANENANNAKVNQAWQGVQQAEQARGQAQTQMYDHYAANQNEAGNGLMGNSTYIAPNGQAMVLPHTWQPNTTNVYNGNTYHVDPSGQYWVYGADGNWYPLKP